jgi:hypothetical protein
MIQVLRVLAFALGAACLLIGIGHVVVGPDIIRGGVPVNATMDSEDRFFGALFAAFGLAWLWCAADLAARRNVALCLSAAFFAGGLARLVSMVAAGWPDELYIALAGVELFLPILFAVGLCRNTIAT